VLMTMIFLTIVYETPAIITNEVVQILKFGYFPYFALELKTNRSILLENLRQWFICFAMIVRN